MADNRHIGCACVVQVCATFVFSTPALRKFCAASAREVKKQPAARTDVRAAGVD